MEMEMEVGNGGGGRRGRQEIGTKIYITALDGIVNVNSLFTFAVFIGLAWNPTDPANSLVDNPACVPGPKIAEDLISFHVFSFSSFLFSSLIALGLKQAIKVSKRGGGGGGGHEEEVVHHHDNNNNTTMARVNKTVLRGSILASAVGSVCGCGFLMLALVNVVQIKLGTLSCPSRYSLGAIVPLVIFVPAALLIYICIVFYAFTR